MSKTTENTGKKKKNPIVIALIVLAVIWFLIPTGNSQKTETPAPAEEPAEAAEAAEPAAQTIEVTVTASARKDEAGGLIIDVETNLPEGTGLGVDIRSGDYNTDVNYTGESSITVADGKGSTEAFTAKGEPLSGDYDVSITMPIPRRQSPEVQAIIGEKGENLTGPLVEVFDITGDNTVNALFALHVGDEVTMEPEEDYQYTIFAEYDDDEEGEAGE